MKRTILNVLLLAATAIGIASCGNTSNQASAQNRVTVNQSQPQAQDIAIDDAHVPDFDVNAFAGLLTKTADATALEQAINTPDNAINHLHQNDPNGNPPKIDYLKVDQVSNSQMVVYDETPNGKVTVATLNINTQNNSYSVAGSPTYCGSDPSMYSYQSQPGLSFGQLLFLSWMITPHPYGFYHPHWGYGYGYYRGYHSYGYNPGYRNSYRTSYRTTYRTTYNATHPSGNRSTLRTNTPQQRVNTPQQRATQTPARASATNPTNTQRQFRANESNRFKSTGSNVSGFRSTPTPARQSTPTRSAPTRSSSSSSSRGGFGGGRSSGGRSGRR